MEGWDSLREADTTTFTPDQTSQDLDQAFVRTFSTESGQIVMEHLISVTIDQPAWYPGEDPSHGYAREGQNSIVREIMKRIARGRDL